MGAASRELVRGWGYEPSIETLLRVVRALAAAADQRCQPPIASR